MHTPARRRTLLGAPALLLAAALPGPRRAALAQESMQNRGG